MSPFHHRQWPEKGKHHIQVEKDPYLPDVLNRPALMYFAWRATHMLRTKVTIEHSKYRLRNNEILKEEQALVEDERLAPFT